MIIYGIKSCDTMKKAMTWLNANNFEYTFHDYKVEGITEEKITEWLKFFPLNALINTKGTTYKGLTDEEKASISDKKKAMELILANTSMIKRPVLETGKGMLLGFDAQKWEQELFWA